MASSVALAMPSLVPILLVAGLSSSTSTTSTSTSAEPTASKADSESKLFRPGILLQTWVQVTRASGATSSGLRLRRAELHAKGELIEKRIAYRLMIDAAKVLETREKPVVSSRDGMFESVVVREPVSAISVLQDSEITLITEWADVTVGQFKIPVSLEGVGSSGKLLFPERAIVARELGDRRDLGIRVAKRFGLFGYNVGLFNGAGLNALETDNEKDCALRLELYPIEGLLVAGVFYATIGSRDRARDRYEVDLKVERGPFVFQAEYIRGRDRGEAAPVHVHGFYAATGFAIGPVQPVLRVGYFDPDLNADVDPAASRGRDERWHVDVGANWLVMDHQVKLQVAYQILAFDQQKAAHEVLIAPQITF